MRISSPARHALVASFASFALAATALAAGPSSPAFDRASLDTTCSPCRDFFQFANGSWLARHTIPAAYSRWGSFDELAENNREVLHRILESARRDPQAAPGSDRWRIGTYYGACMDSAAAEAAGISPIQPLLQGVEAVASVSDLSPELARLQSEGVPGLFFFRAAQDPKNSDLMIAFAGQGGIGLPDRDYYFRSDSASKATRQAYLESIGRLLQMAGADEATTQADAAHILTLETALAAASMTNV
jgi:putative endopeptidase